MTPLPSTLARWLLAALLFTHTHTHNETPCNEMDGLIDISFLPSFLPSFNSSTLLGIILLDHYSIASFFILFNSSKSNNPRQRVTSGLIQRPAGVAVSPWTGEIYVAGTDSHRVYIIDKNGKIVRSMGSPANNSASHVITHSILQSVGGR